MICGLGNGGFGENTGAANRLIVEPSGCSRLSYVRLAASAAKPLGPVGVVRARTVPMKGKCFSCQKRCPIEAGHSYRGDDRDMARGHDWQPQGLNLHYACLMSRLSTRRSVRGDGTWGGFRGGGGRGGRRRKERGGGGEGGMLECGNVRKM